MIVITIIALIVNVGLFVKAKINLQNAVDAAAFSGAATQSRQLTSIAYLNWEMRNVYKEWMFKYYVLGNIGLRNLNGPGEVALGNNVSNFQMRTFSVGGSTPTLGALDQYNIPSICVQFANTTADCDNYKLPELPRFNTSTQLGIANTADVFVDNLSAIRSKACADKSRVNFEVANMWAFSVGHGNDDLANNAPQLLSDRPGAYTKAFELAVRIRNLESLVNEAPLTTGICSDPAQAAKSCSHNINQIASSGSPHSERSVKAFYSAYRNLGSEDDNEMKSSFVLTEIPPTSQDFANTTLSGLIYPETTVTKYYVDLRMMPVNYATFYTAFVTPPTSAESAAGINLGNAGAFTGGCDATKVAIPVPGYPLGFVKSPDFLTYYAVKGEANFVGLFNPFVGNIKLTAYSAAKPFGGRIGPSIFNTQDNNNYITLKDDFRSRHYAAALDMDGSTIYPRTGTTPIPKPYDPFIIGAPLPILDFWVNDNNQALGGDPTGPTQLDIRFSIPNLVYTAQGSASDNINVMTITPGFPDTLKPVGLYSFDEFNRFKGSLGNGATTLDGNMMINAVLNARAPTDYDAYNYLIPSPADTNRSLETDSFGAITGSPDNNGAYNWSIYAPLYDNSGHFPYATADQFRESFREYLLKQDIAIKVYLKTMKEIADGVAAAANDANFSITYEESAKVFSDANSGDGIAGLTCESMAGAFYYYFLGTDSGMSNDPACPKPFFESFAEFWSLNNQRITHYQNENNFRYLPGTQPRDLFTAYSPGPRQGADQNGVVQHPIFSQRQNMIRNFYSTKFVALQSLSSKGDAVGTYNDANNFAVFSQGTKEVSSETRQNSSKIHNEIDSSYIHIDFNDYLK